MREVVVPQEDWQSGASTSTTVLTCNYTLLVVLVLFCLGATKLRSSTTMVTIVIGG